ncbi:MAG: hypothetical protein ACLGHT_04995 [Acidimicrobiia bacterium]
METQDVLHLRLPPEDELPVFASGCCAVAPDDAIRSELDSWRGVRTVTVDLQRRHVEVALGVTAPAVTDLIESLHDLGIDTEPVTDTRSSGCDIHQGTNGGADAQGD